MDPHGTTGERGPTGERYRFSKIASDNGVPGDSVDSVPDDDLSGEIGSGEIAPGEIASGEIVVDAAAHTLTRDGHLQPLEPKAFAVLLLLLRHAGEMVTHEQLMDAVWGHRHVTPGVLTRAIGQLRHALGDRPHESFYIQTQHALGYRFIGVLAGEPAATVASGPPATAAATTVDEPVAPAASAPMPASAGALATLPMPAAVARKPGWRGWPVWALAALAAMVLGVIVFTWLRGDAGPPRAGEPSIAVLPFTSVGNKGDNGYFADGLTAEMHEALASVPGLKVAARGSAAEAQRRNPDAKAIGDALGVATVLDASVRREGQRVRINARLSDTATGFTLWSNSYDREISDVFAVQSEIASEVVQALLGVLPAGGKALGKRLTPTHDIAAYEAYLKGMQQLLATDEQTHLERAVDYFNQALAADSGFARAQAGICRAEIARFEEARDTPAFERAQEACLRASRMDPELREVSLALGEMYRVRGDFSQASEQYLRALDDVALRPAAYIGLARTQSAQGRNALALDYFEQARQLSPGDSTVYRELGYHQYLSGDIDAAIETFRTAIGLLPDDAGLWSSLGGLYLTAGDIPRAEEAFERSLEVKPSVAALTNFGTLRYGQRAYAEAADLYRHASELDPDDFRIWGNLGDALSALPASAAAARGPYQRAAQMAASYVEVKPDDAQALALLGWYRANLDQARLARQRLLQAEALQTARGEVALINAQTLARLGDIDGAHERLAAARAADVPASRIQASPLLRSLPHTRREPRGSTNKMHGRVRSKPSRRPVFRGQHPGGRHACDTQTCDISGDDRVDGGGRIDVHRLRPLAGRRRRPRV